MTRLDSSSVRINLDSRPPSRCCDRHPDWPTLTEHLLKDFPEIHIADIVHELRTARDLVEGAGMDGSKALTIAELMVRQQLWIRAGN